MNGEVQRYLWRPITDLPENWRSFESKELAHLIAIWSDQSQELEGTDAIQEFNARLRREWAIETGVIEGLYDIDRGTTVQLIEKGIEVSLIAHGASNKPAELVVEIIRVQQEALEGLFDFVANRRELSKAYVKQLHQVITSRQETVEGIDHLGNPVNAPLIRGDWKRLPNNPMRPGSFIREYCPPEHVESEMDNLVDWHLKHREHDVPPEVEAAWLHHRFTQIHPFQDGNGRIARTLASLVFLRGRCHPLSINRDLRAEYVSALEEADRGDLAPLTKLFVQIQRRSLVRALSVSETVLRQRRPLGHTIHAATQRLKEKFEGKLDNQRQVFERAEDLKRVVVEYFAVVRDQLTESFRELEVVPSVSLSQSDSESQGWYIGQIISLAREMGYFADVRTYSTWVRLRIREERQAEIVVSFHSLGSRFVGIVAATSFLLFRDRDEDGMASLDGPYQLCDEPFEFTFHDDAQALEDRFREWLNRVAAMGIEEWRRRI